MSEPAILFVRPGAIKPADKGRLRKAGVIVIETEEPEAVKFTRASTAAPVEELSHGELLAALARAIKRHGNSYVGEEVCNAIIRRHAQEAPKS